MFDLLIQADKEEEAKEDERRDWCVIVSAETCKAMYCTCSHVLLPRYLIKVLTRTSWHIPD